MLHDDSTQAADWLASLAESASSVRKFTQHTLLESSLRQLICMYRTRHTKTLRRGQSIAEQISYTHDVALRDMGSRAVAVLHD